MMAYLLLLVLLNVGVDFSQDVLVLVLVGLLDSSGQLRGTVCDRSVGHDGSCGKKSGGRDGKRKAQQ